MTREDTIRMAREAGYLCEEDWITYGLSKFEHFAALVAAHEREECAKVCNTADKSTHPADLANSIRARGEK